MEKTYSVVTIGYKSLENIKNRVNECFNGDNPPNEFILIINNYSDESWAILEYAKIEKRITRYIFSSQNIGFAKAINIGYKISKSDNLIILNDDCKVNQDTCFKLSEMLVNNYGISTVLLGGKFEDILPMPQGFILGVRKDVIELCGGYVYDEIASPLGCERELTYRVKTKGYNLISDSGLFCQHVHDISNHPSDTINYLGKNMSPKGENAFQDDTEIELNKKINEHKVKIINGIN